MDADNLAPYVTRSSATMALTMQDKWVYIDGLVQERHNSSVLAMELCLSCTNPSISSIGKVFSHLGHLSTERL